MIESVFVQNFMRIDGRVHVPLGPVTVLVGANGSGKSSVLKALHWSVRCATLRDRNSKTTLEQMDYTPTREFLELAHKKKIQNAETSPKIVVGFIDANGDETTIKLSAARNEAGVKSEIDGPLAQSLTSEIPQTAYIPGLAGLAESETVLAQPVLHRRAASGEGGSVLRHILLDLVEGSGSTQTDYRELNELADWVSKVVNKVQFWVKFDRLRDVNIDAQFLTEDMRAPGKNVAQLRKPLELAGTGFLQIVQIFAYLLKFRPALILIDEPDAHLHPSTQERLIKAIEEATQVFPNTKFLITTHSPALVRACGPMTKVLWMEGGQLSREPEEIIRQRMGWGALDKDLILFTEDENVSMLSGIISQWPELSRRILLWPTFGNGALLSGQALRKLRDNLKIKVALHRDRDFMSNSDIEGWKNKKGYSDHAIPVWVTPGSDIEAAFCSRDAVAASLSIEATEADEIISCALRLVDPEAVERDFNTAINSAISSLPADQRSVPSARWRELGELSVHTVKGKVLLNAIERAVRERWIGTPNSPKLAHLRKVRAPCPQHAVCLCLKETLDALLLEDAEVAETVAA